MRTRQVSRMPIRQKTHGRGELVECEREPAAAGKQAQQNELDGGGERECGERKRELRPARRAREPDPRQDHREQDERHGARRERENRQ